MSLKNQSLEFFYQNIFKPVAFTLDAETIHNGVTVLGETLEKRKQLISYLFSQQNNKLNKKLLGIEFENPIGLAAGFDYDGHLAEILKYVGFGFNTVGTVTARPYAGNPKPRLLRLPKSKSILVNKGFKSEGAVAVAERLDKKDLIKHTVGISVGSTNTPEIDAINKSIADYLFTFDLFNKKDYIKYFELNISCPNTALTESFTKRNNFRKLVKEIASLNIKKPIFVKMPNEADPKESDELIKIALKYEIRGFIFSNLAKNRNNPALIRKEIKKVKDQEGNFSGEPAVKNANFLISHAHKTFGKDIVIVGCGGVFAPEDVFEKIACGADLIQLITGIIYQGPQLISQICEELNKNSVKA